MAPRVHQFTAGFAHADAISNLARFVRDTLRGWGFESEIYCEAKRILPSLRNEVRDITRVADEITADDIVILQMSIGSVVNDVFRKVRCRKVMLYQNITPAHFFARIQPETATHLAWGRRQLAELAGCADINLAASRFNASELEALGYRDVGIMPLPIDFASLTPAGDGAVRRALQGAHGTVVSVGRVAPNKRIEEHLQAFALFRRLHAPDARFVHVGSYAGTERYYFLLQAMARELGVADAVTFTGSVPQRELNTWLAGARMMLCMSAHEGFCVPLLEAMFHDCPVLAAEAGAMPETLGGAGVLLHERDPGLLAETMGALERDPQLRAGVLQRQRARLAAYREQDLVAMLRDRLAPLLKGAAV